MPEEITPDETTFTQAVDGMNYQMATRYKANKKQKKRKLICVKDGRTECH